MIVRGRVIKNAVHAERVGEATATAIEPVYKVGRRVAKEVTDAHARAEEILKNAEAGAMDIRNTAKRRGEEEAKADFAAAYLRLRAREEEMQKNDLGRSVELARVLAERLIGEALSTDPALIFKMANVALEEARGARKVKIIAHPLDAATLRSDISRIGSIAEIVAIEESEHLARGSLTLATDLGTLDAHIAPQLERLSRALQDALNERR